MGFELKDILTAIGQSASLVFAAWIFMGYLQQRYTAAYERYRSLIGDYRSGGLAPNRRGNVRSEVLLYRRRCELMRTATNIGLVAAILLIATLIAGAVNSVFSGLWWLKYVGAAAAVTGLALVIAATALVIVENSIIKRAFESELLDMPEFAGAAGEAAPGAAAARQAI